MLKLKPQKRRYNHYRGRYLDKKREQQSKRKMPLATRSLIAAIILAVVLVSSYAPFAPTERLNSAFKYVFLSHLSAQEAGAIVASMGSAGERIAQVFGYQEPVAEPSESVMAMTEIPRFGLPVVGVVSQSFSAETNGIRLAASEGYPVVAVLSGNIASVQDDPELGMTITIDHGRGLQTVYGHLNGASVDKGATITQGSTIGYVGKSGNAVSPTLYFSVRLGEKHVDPLSLIKGK